jgi:hypothetical protein
MHIERYLIVMKLVGTFQNKISGCTSGVRVYYVFFTSNDDGVSYFHFYNFFETLYIYLQTWYLGNLATLGTTWYFGLSNTSTSSSYCTLGTYVRRGRLPVPSTKYYTRILVYKYIYIFSIKSINIYQVQNSNLGTTRRFLLVGSYFNI